MLNNTNTLFVIFTIIVITVLIADTALSKVSDILGKRSYLGWSTAVYISLNCAFVVSQVFLLRFAKKKITQLGINKVPHLKLLHSMVTITQYLLVAIIIFLNYQIIVTSHYNVVVIEVATTISDSLALFVLAVLS